MSDRMKTVQTWLTFTVAVLALILSSINFVQANRRPALEMDMPTYLGIGARPAPMWVIIQPSLTISRKSDRTSRVTSMRLEMSPPPGVPAAPFAWQDIGKLEQLAVAGKNTTYTYSYDSDPAPIIVQQDSPQRPSLRFTAPGEMSPGTWVGTLSAEREGDAPISKQFCLIVTRQNIDEAARNNWYFSRYANPDPLRNGSCYVRTPSTTLPAG